MYKRLPFLIILTAFAFSLRASPPIGAVVQSWDIDAKNNTVTLHMVNTSGKDITAYSIKIRETYGQHINEHEFSMDSVALMFNIQERVGTPEGDEWQKRFGNGSFPSGSIRDEVIHVQTGLTDFSAVVDTVIYVDKTAETSSPDPLKRLLDARKAFAASIQAGNDIIQKAPANPNDPNPDQTALRQIEAVQKDWEANHHQANLNAAALHEVMEDLKHAGVAAPKHGQSIRDYLNNYVAKRNERAARLLEHANAKTGGQ